MNNSQVNNRYHLRLTIVTLSLASCLLAFRIFGQLNNSLARNSQWTSTKIGLEKSVNGAYEYFYWLQALAHEKLNLGAWYGYQELITKKPLNVGRISADFSLTPNSYVDIVYNKNPLSYYTLRISNNSLFPSALIRLKNTGEYESVTLIDTSKINLDNWHRLDLNFDFQKSLVTISLDRQNLGELSIPVFTQPISVGLRGSHEPSYVDNFTIYDQFGTKVFSDDFSFHDPHPILKIFMILAFLILILVLGHTRPLPTILILINIVILLSTTTLYLHFFYVANYPNPNSPLSKFKSLFATVDKSESLTFSQKMSQEIVDSVIPDKRPRILFLGTSQTWGAGAAKHDETYVKVIEKEIDTHIKTNYQLINAGISGSSSTEILDFYKNSWLKLNPKMVLVDLSSNDLDPELFAKNLEELVDINKKLGITTIFLLEANSVNTPVDTGLPLHPFMTTVANIKNIRLINIHEYLKGQSKLGNLWWDKVHPTTFGHQLLGQFIYQNIKDLLLP